MIATDGEGEGRELIKLTVKDKVLLQMGEHACEPDVGEYPLELTQKGLSDSLGVRRSHIAASMKGLLEEGFAEARKGHIEGEERRQNVYLLTPRGCARAKELRLKVLAIIVDIDNDGEVHNASIEDVLKSTKLTLASVINQLERGGPINSETTIVTKPGRKLIPVYCPTCKRSFEVENLYGNEEVGFDCPGCARPYRVVPLQKELPEKRVAHVSATKGQLAATVLSVIIALVFLEISIFRPGFLSNIFTTLLFVAIPATLLLIYFVNWKMTEKPRNIASVGGGVVVIMVLLGIILAVLWNNLIISVDFERELEVFLVLLVALAFGYLGIPAAPVQSRGEYLLAAGGVLATLGITLPFLRDIEGLTMTSVPFLVVFGMTSMILSTLHYVNRENQLLDLVLAGGIVILFISVVELLPERSSALDVLIFCGFLLLGVFMILLRFAQRVAAIDLGEQFLAAAALSIGVLFAVLGAFMIWGESLVAGIAEIVLISPFIYYGLRKVFNDEWMYRVPIVAFLGFLETLVITDAFLT